MSSIPIGGPGGADKTAPTPQNTPLTAAPISQGIALPTVPAISEEDEGGALGAGLISRDAILGMVKGRLNDLVGRSSGYIESLPLPTKLRVQALKGVQTKQDDLHNQYKLECLALEKKYHGLAEPLVTRRNELINGLGSGPSGDEITKGEEQSKQDDDEYEVLNQTSEEAKKEDTTGIPEFWLTALKNHIGLSEIISERDEEALQSLKDVKLTYLEDKPGFQLSFIFDSNDFFEQTELIKTYIYQPEVGYSGDFVYDRAVGTDIKWKEDKNLTKEVVVKKQRNKNTNQTRLVKKSVPVDSFFNFFEPPAPPKPEDEDDEDDEDAEDIDERLALDYQLGEDFKEKIIPKAVDYFTGKALEWDIMNAESDSDWDDEDEDDEDGLGEDDDDDEDED